MDESKVTALNQEIQSLMSEVFQVSEAEIAPELAFGDLPQWDSLGHMELMIRLEEQYGVEITADTIAELVSLPAIQAYLARANGKE